jgi:hypothetical protein
MGASMPFWCCARLLPRREQLALHCLSLAGFQTYYPRLREVRRSYGRKIEVRSALFPSYGFVLVVAAWHDARWSPGVAALIMDGAAPARVPARVIDEIRAREVRGLIELPEPRLEPGTRVRVLRGPLEANSGCALGCDRTSVSWSSCSSLAVRGGWSCRRTMLRR